MGLGYIYGEHVDVVAKFGVLIVALAGEAFEADAVAAQNAQQQGNGVASGGEGANPAAEVGHALLEGQLQPVVIGGKVEGAGAAGHEHALLYAHEPFVFTQVLAEFLLDFLQVLSGLVEVVLFGSGVVLLAFGLGNLLTLAFELLQDVELEFGAGGAIHDFKQGAEGGVVCPRLWVADGGVEAGKEMLEAQEVADAFGQGMFEGDDGGHGSTTE